jgi:sulfate adenylyltransferase subunit 2
VNGLTPQLAALESEAIHMGWLQAEEPRHLNVRFRTLRYWPAAVTIASEAATIDPVVLETLTARTSERICRISDSGSLESQKRDGYF